MINQNEFDFEQLFSADLDSLDIDFDANHPSNYEIPSININRSNIQDSQPPLSPIQTDIMMHGNLSPVFSSPSHTSGSSHGFLSPRHADPLTPSPVSPYEQSFIGIQSPEFPMRWFESQSPATSTLGLSSDKMQMQPDQSPGTSSSRSSLVPPLSSSSSSSSENFSYNPSSAWPGMQMIPHHGRSASISSGTSRPYYQDLSGPSSAPTTSTMSFATPEERSTLSHAEQYQSWKDTPGRCPIAGLVRLFVPQRMYKPHTGSDRRRYVEEVRLSLPIIFEVEHPSEWGIPLDDALKSRTKNLVDKDALMFDGCGPSVSIRLEWPGAPWSRQIPTKDFRSPPGPITKAKLAKNIAKCVQRFIKDVQDKPVNEEEDANALRFKVGTGANDVKLEDLVLVSLHHVSQGSWQPHLRLRREIQACQ
ncbi:hypothetical protein PILCRDRAFT_819755 [Piloderma croceum F 1598]|uniref:Uncharacterized protein n=1 Tax=Piloderma croceum (strain F 1598) TaxID=765440 RepID=A0A0C3FEQ4_PILCF|nr:hypothetical protein PILCRDRAFT_819755 [Piloderma croceum F 1598]